MRYKANLSRFVAVCCFPRTFEEWSAVTQDSEGLSLVWTTRFKVHVDQVIGVAHRVEHSRARRSKGNICRFSLRLQQVLAFAPSMQGRLVGAVRPCPVFPCRNGKKDTLASR
jgi:hypothetical protein